MLQPPLYLSITAVFYVMIIAGYKRGEQIMGKIKSARELALERADKLAGSVDSNPEDFAFAQYTRAAALLAASYLDNKLTLGRLAESIGNYPAAALPAAKKSLLQGITAGLNPDTCEQVLAAYQKLASELLSGEAGAALQEVCRAYREQLEKERARLEQAGSEALLKDSGISGSAVAAINLERTTQWLQAKNALNREFNVLLQQIKRHLEETLHSNA